MGDASSGGTGQPVVIGAMIEDPLRLAGLQDMLGADGFSVVPLAEAKRHQGTPLVALVDVASAPHLQALLQQLQRTWPEVQVIVLGPDAAPGEIARVVGVGAKGYLNYTAGVQEVKMALGVVLEGSIWAPRKVLAQLLARRQDATEPPVLTRREQQVLRLLVQGCPNRAIAAALQVDEATVKAHLGRLMRKLRVRNRIALSMHPLARQAGSVDE